MFKHIDINVKLAEKDIINNMKRHIAIKCEENQETISRLKLLLVKLLEYSDK